MTPEEYNDLYSESFNKQMRIVVEDTDVVITNPIICSETMSINESLNSDVNLKFGSCESSCFQIRVANIESSLKGKWLDVNMDVAARILPEKWITENGEYVVDETDDELMFGEMIDAHSISLGRYKVKDDVPTNDRCWRDLTCFDVMYDILNADVSAWFESLTFPMTIKNFRDSFFTYLDIEQVETTLINDSFVTHGGFVVDGQLAGKTVINAICELNGCFGHITTDGKFDYVYIPNGDSVTLNWYIDGSGSYEDYTVQKITGIVARSEDLDVGTSVGTTTNQYVIENNPLIFGSEGTADLTTALTNLLGVISQVTYRPFKVETYGNPMLPLGTGITVKTRNQTINSIVISKYMTGIQALKDSIVATGDKTLPSNVNNIQSEISRTKGKVHKLKNTVDELSSEITAVSKLSIPILPVTRWIYNTYDDGRVQYQIVDEPELDYLDFTFASSDRLRFAIRGISLSDYYNAKKKEIYIKKGNTEIQALIRNLDNSVVTTEIIADELITLEYYQRTSGNPSYFWVLPDSYASAQNIKTNTLIQQTADAINLKVSETVHATVPTSDYTDYATDVSTDTITFKFIDLPIFELIDITNSTFRFGMNVPDNFNDTQKARKKAIRIESTSGGTSQVITAPIFNEDGTQVTDEIFSGKVVYLERATRTIGSSSVSGFWLYSDSYTQSQINMTKDQIVLKVDSSGNMYKTALGDAASSGSSFKIGANNISFITNGTIEMTSNDIAIDSTNFKVDKNGNVEAKNFAVAVDYDGTANAFNVIDEDDFTIGSWGHDGFLALHTYTESSPQRQIDYWEHSCEFICKNIYENTTVGNHEEFMKFDGAGLTVQLLKDPFETDPSNRTNYLRVQGYNGTSKKYIDIFNSSGWGTGNTSLRETIASEIVRFQIYTGVITSMTANAKNSITIPYVGNHGYRIWDYSFLGIIGFQGIPTDLSYMGFSIDSNTNDLTVYFYNHSSYTSYGGVGLTLMYTKLSPTAI